MIVTRLGLALVKGTRHLDHEELEFDAQGPIGDRTFCLVDRACGRVLKTVENPRLVGVEVRATGVGLVATTLVTTGSLARLARASGNAGRDLGVRFRATMTLELDSDPAPGARLSVGDLEIEVTRPISRCAVIDLDPATGERTNAPAATHSVGAWRDSVRDVCAGGSARHRSARGRRPRAVSAAELTRSDGYSSAECGPVAPSPKFVTGSSPPRRSPRRADG